MSGTAATAGGAEVAKEAAPDEACRDSGGGGGGGGGHATTANAGGGDIRATAARAATPHQNHAWSNPDGPPVTHVGSDATGSRCALEDLRALYLGNRFGPDAFLPSPPLLAPSSPSPSTSSASTSTNQDTADARNQGDRTNQDNSAQSSPHSHHHHLQHHLQPHETYLRPYPIVRRLPMRTRKRILVTGGAGFVGSHLVDRLMIMGHEVIVMDNFFTGDKRNIQHWIGHPNFELLRHDVVESILIEVDQIYHLACPASPPHYQYNPIKTVKTSVMGTINMLGLAKRVKARFLLASTSEIYGDPEEHPQKETYWGRVNPIGPRACYDEGKRVAETLTYSYAKQDRVDVRVARIFNTFGPRMNPEDGRVVSNFIVQALRGQDLTVYGDGSQTRSFQYVHDLVDGLIQLMASGCTEPVNLGNPDEYTMQAFAHLIRDLVCPDVGIVNLPATTDDPLRRRPDITRAKTVIGWEPRFSVKQGIEETVAYFRERVKDM